MKRIRRASLHQNGDWKAFLLVSSIIVVPLLATIGIINVSSRPSLAFRTFSKTPIDNSPVPLDWPTLAKLREKAVMLSATAPAVRIPGYMIQFDDPLDETGRLARFLLVPDPGNWLHPPHLDDGEVVIVRMRDRARTSLLDRKPVWVQGWLSLSPVKTDGIQTMFQLEASGVDEFQDVLP